MPSLITDLHQIEKLARERHDEFEVMRYQLQLEEGLNDTNLDEIVNEIAQPIVEAIDCTTCANCCRVLDVYLTPADVNQIITNTEIALSDIPTRIIDHETAQADGEWSKFRDKPCTFLHNNHCTIYAHRPETCRTYPMFTPDFRWVLDDMIEGATVCPIIYNVLEKMTTLVHEIIKEA